MKAVALTDLEIQILVSVLQRLMTALKEPKTEAEIENMIHTAEDDVMRAIEEELRSEEKKRTD